jgi:hypothetical protein
LVNIEQIKKEIDEEKKTKQEMLELNKKIYHQLVPNDEDLIFQEKNFMSMTLPNDLYIGENEKRLQNDENIICLDLKLLCKNKHQSESQLLEKDLKNALIEYRNAFTQEEKSQAKSKSLKLLNKKNI